MVGRKKSLVGPWDYPKRLVYFIGFSFCNRAGATYRSVACGFYLFCDFAFARINNNLMQSLLGVTGVQVHLQSSGQRGCNIQRLMQLPCSRQALRLMLQRDLPTLLD